MLLDGFPHDQRVSIQVQKIASGGVLARRSYFPAPTPHLRFKIAGNGRVNRFTRLIKTGVQTRLGGFGNVSSGSTNGKHPIPIRGA